MFMKYELWEKNSIPIPNPTPAKKVVFTFPLNFYHQFQTFFITNFKFSLIKIYKKRVWSMVSILFKLI